MSATPRPVERQRVPAGLFSIQRAAGDTQGASSGAQILSSASATIRGVELEATIRPLTSLELGLNYSYIDAKYANGTPSTPGEQFGAGFAHPASVA